MTDHVNRILLLLQLYDVQLDQSFEPKNAHLSVQRRQDGDRLSEAGDLAEALVKLNQAVVQAPTKGADLALALWSRSGILLRLGNGQRALSDLLYAGECGLFAKQDAAYYLRQFWAHAMTGNKAKALICLGLCEAKCDNPEVRRGLAEHRTNIDMIVCQPKKLIPQEPLLTNGAHSLLTGASSLLEVRTAAGPAGRHVIAGQPIGAGDTLLVEQPLVACLLLDTHCLHCMGSLAAPGAVSYGCDTCSTVAFCSPDCQRIACSTYHRYECRFGKLAEKADVLAFLRFTLRAVTQCASVEEALRRCQFVFELCDHEAAREPQERLENGKMAILLTHSLQKSGFFGTECPEGLATEFGSDELQVAAVLLALIDRQQFNWFAINETLPNRDDSYNAVKHDIGRGLYKTGSLFNHDCDPSAVWHFVGRTLVLTAIRPLRTGEPVTISYGPRYWHETREKRQLCLRNYQFTCECRSCAEDWPLLQQLDVLPKLRCPTASCVAVHRYPKIAGRPVKCRECRKLVSLQDSVQQLKLCEQQFRAVHLRWTASSQGAVPALAKVIDQFYTVAVAPTIGIQHIQTYMEFCVPMKIAVSGVNFD